MTSVRPLFIFLSLLLPFTAFAALDEGVNALRKRGCDGKAGVNRPLRSSLLLDAVAREWSRGGSLKEAFARTDYRMANSASMRIAGAPDERTILGILAKNYCAAVIDPSFTELGVHRRDGGVWIVVAEPFTTPTTKDAARIGREVLQRVNEARGAGRKCGRRSFGPAPALKLAPLLERAALAHAEDMAKHSLFEHRGSNGGMPADRVTKTGYRWRTVAENIAAGGRDAETVVRGWLESPGHCANVMGAQYSEMGVAYAVDPKSKAGIYWAQVFASPR